MADGKRYTLISSDAHAGADIEGYKPYLASEFHDEFDAWAATFDTVWKELDAGVVNPDDPNLHVGACSFLSPYNWDSAKRLEHQNAEGVAAEVLFPNTVPPFYPSGVVSAPGPSTAEEYRYRWAGVQAHNRWLVDFCAEAPGRRGGLAQVFLGDIDEAIAEARWAKDAGLVGVLIPSDHSQQLVDLYERRLDPFWAACAEIEMPVHRHTVSVNPPETPETGPAAPAIGVHDSLIFFSRGIGHLVLGGVFERFPELKFVFTETTCGILAMQLQVLEGEFVIGGQMGSSVYPFFHRVIESATMSPMECFHRNCYIGASLLTSMDLGLRDQLGVDRIMWGSDYPHHEGTYPHTTLGLRLNFADVPEDEVRAMTSLNAAELYGFDLDYLQTIADEIGPTVEEVATPVAPEELPAVSSSVTIADAILTTAS